MQMRGNLLLSSPMTWRKLLGLATTAALWAGGARATEWKVIKRQDRDYVSFEDVAQFYRFQEFQHSNRTVSLRSERRQLRAQAGTSELFINGVRFFTCLPLLERADATLVSATDVNKIIEPVLRPSRIKNAAKVETVVLDPGHGGMDNGASSSWGAEKNFALDVACAAREQLLRANFRVEMTRSGDTAMSLEERIEFANRFSNAVFVSIHFNSSSGGAGVESYSFAPDGVASNASSGEQHLSTPDLSPNEGNAQDAQNIALTAAVHAAVLSHASAFDRGIRHARFKVLRHIRIPAVLLEAGFLNDPVEGQKIATPQYRQQLGAAIAQGVQSYDAAVNYRSDNRSALAAASQAKASTPEATPEPTVSIHAHE